MFQQTEVFHNQKRINAREHTVKMAPHEFDILPIFMGLIPVIMSTYTSFNLTQNWTLQETQFYCSYAFTQL